MNPTQPYTQSLDIKKLAVIALSIFGAMFLFRLGYGYTKSAQTRSGYYQINQSRNNFESYSKVNIATAKFAYKGESGRVINVDQKYEKIATIESETTKIKEDEQKIRGLVKESGSVIQFENTSGLETQKDRVVDLVIGVPPEKFDEFTEQVKEIGKLTSISIDKRDKTNEYKELQANKDSLMKIRNSLIALKNKGGKIDEYINLENRILEIEEKIQKLGLSLGEFDSENEFCTVKLTLNETSVYTIGFLHRIKVALQWTIKYYCIFAIGFFFMVIALNLAIKLFQFFTKDLNLNIKGIAGKPAQGTATTTATKSNGSIKEKRQAKKVIRK